MPRPISPIPEPVNLRIGGTVRKLREQLPQLRRENSVEVWSVLEEGKETYTYTPPVLRGNEPVTGQHSRHEAATVGAMAPAPPPDAIRALQRRVEALSARVARQTRRGTNTELTGLAPLSLTYGAPSCP
ncbi:hypothetical protein LIER_24792 [Lithospermum erythrorhizon]|uniref:Uncharacterized protein n=1 Tax=Lithospermum erythrorhizon TaxID=34254 RepID=A0AAV3R8C0_LITER